MKYAVVQLGGKQFQIKEGDTFKIERQSSLLFNVLMFSEDGKVELGTPFLSDVEVKAEIKEDIRGPKIRIGRYKSKSRYRRIKGHKQPLSIVEIQSIGKKLAKEKVEKPKTASVKEEKVSTAKKTTRKTPAKKSVAKKSTNSVKKGTAKK